MTFSNYASPVSIINYRLIRIFIFLYKYPADIHVRKDVDTNRLQFYLIMLRIKKGWNNFLLLFKIHTMLQYSLKEFLVFLPAFSFSFELLLFFKFLSSTCFAQTLPLRALVRFDVYSRFQSSVAANLAKNLIKSIENYDLFDTSLCFYFVFLSLQ